jgi:hypothetical protein
MDIARYRLSLAGDDEQAVPCSALSDDADEAARLASLIRLRSARIVNRQFWNLVEIAHFQLNRESIGRKCSLLYRTKAGITLHLQGEQTLNSDIYRFLGKKVYVDRPWSFVGICETGLSAAFHSVLGETFF